MSFLHKRYREVPVKDNITLGDLEDTFLTPQNPYKKVKLSQDMFDIAPQFSLSIGGSGTQTQGPAPVSLTGGQVLYVGKGKYRSKRRANLLTRAKRDTNVVTYRYQMESPWHAPFGANSLINHIGAVGTAGSLVWPNSGPPDGTFRVAPVALYDITCAPNYAASNPATPLASSLITCNTPVAMRMFETLNWDRGGTNTTGGYVGPGRFPRTVSFYGAYDKGVTPGGMEGDNRWEVQYLKKNFFEWPGTAASVPDGVPVDDADTAIAGNVGRKIALPVVGRKPVHRSTRINFSCQGLSSAPVTWDVLVFGLRGDHLHPVPVDADIDYGKMVQTDLVTSKQSCYTGVPYASRTLGHDRSREDNEFVKFWHAFAGQYGDSLGNQDLGLLKKYIVPIKHKVITIDPKSTIEKDTIGYVRKYSINLRWDKIRNFGWQNGNPQGVHPAFDNYADPGSRQAIGTTVNSTLNGVPDIGPGFATTINSNDTFSTFCQPSNRVYLAVRARLPCSINDTTDATGFQMVNVSGAKESAQDSPLGFSNVTFADKVGTYDITISNTWEIDSHFN